MSDKFNKLKDYIELLNQGLKPKNYDPNTLFSNGTKVNQYWAKNRSKIIGELQNNPIYQTGYEVAKRTIKDYLASLIENRLAEYIELLNKGVITPKDKDPNNFFSDGRPINNFWSNNKDKIINLLYHNPKYQEGYEVAKKTIQEYLDSLHFDYLDDYINLLNNGLIPTSRDTVTLFSNGTKVNQYWANNKELIITTLENNPKYQIGYERAHQVVSTYLTSLNYDKIAEYIKLLNSNKITPRTYDPTHYFSNGDAINYFWSNNSTEIINRLKNNPQYQEGYEVAKEVIKKYLLSINIDKIYEYLTLLNTKKISITNFDPNHHFSNNEPINYFWKTNKDQIIFELNNNPRYQEGYEVAKRLINDYLSKQDINYLKEYIDLLNTGQLNISTYEKNISFHDGRLINRFWSHHKEQIITELKTNPTYQEGYEVAKQTIKLYLSNQTLDKIAEYIELLNNGTITIKYSDKEHFFSNGEPINTFWSNNKDKIYKRISTDSKYQNNYEKAIKEIMKHYSKNNKIHEYIELLNKGYLPQEDETNLSFNNGELIGNFWSLKENRLQIAYELKHNPKYRKGYEIAKKTVNELTNIISYLEGNEKRALKIYSANQKLRQRRHQKENQDFQVEDLLKEFNINITTLNKFLNRTSPSKKRSQNTSLYQGETLKNYCLRKGYNYEVIFRLLKIYRKLPNKSFSELVELAIDTYRHNGQKQPTLWVYEKYGLLLKHLLLLINVDSSGILYNMRKYCLSLEEAIRHEIFKRNIPNKKYLWLEELLNYLVEEMSSDKTEDEITTAIAKRFYDLNKEYNLTDEERTILFDILEKYIVSIRKYLACSFILEPDNELKIIKAKKYNLSFNEIEEAYFTSLRIQGKIILPIEHPQIRHLYILKKYYQIYDMLTKEQQTFLRKTENISDSDIQLMSTIKENINNLIQELNNKNYQPK